MAKQFILALIISISFFSTPVLSDNQEDMDDLDPKVIIIQKEKADVEEYRVGGKLYMIKITPTIGKPYYYIDNDGDGDMETKTYELEADTALPKWILLSW